jgi:hypothetical protein
MCKPEFPDMEKYARLQAKRRAQIANKCDVLKTIDRHISEAKPGDSIYDVLLRARLHVYEDNAGAYDTLVNLLKLEGWKE